MLYKKFNVINFIRSRQIPSTIPGAVEKTSKGLFKKRLEKIEEELNN